VKTPRPITPIRGRLRRHAFSLIELLVALGIFAIVLGIIFQSINEIQRLWGIQRTRMEIYENARLVFDLISRDALGAVTSTDPNGRIMYSPTITGEPNTILAMVTQSGIGVNSGVDSPLAEVVYQLIVTSTTDSDGVIHTDTDLYRWATTSSKGAQYDFYNQVPDTWAVVASLADSELVCRMVDSMLIKCYDRDGNLITTACDTPLSRVDVELTLSDSSALAHTSTYRRSVRTFSKRILTFRGQ
jgi:prepilin-type N-terminal cleavage/methylation domain-containing protein